VVTSRALKATPKKAASKTSKPTTVKATKIAAPPAETPKVETTAKMEAPKVGDSQLATEADFTSPSHPHLSDYRYYAMVDKDNRAVGRGFLARVDSAPRRSWFALRNEEQTRLWETSKWAIREIAFDVYQKLTLTYLKEYDWPRLTIVKSPNQTPDSQRAA
jgi:hypothetical protein